MKADLLLRTRIDVSDDAFVEMVLWRVPEPVQGSAHSYKYRSPVESEICTLRYDNEAVKGDHRHENGQEAAYVFRTVDDLVADFLADVEAKVKR